MGGKRSVIQKRETLLSSRGVLRTEFGTFLSWTLALFAFCNDTQTERRGMKENRQFSAKIEARKCARARSVGERVLYLPKV
ncbi:unnamed protein product [Bathycoccus prasinos]